MDSFGCALSLLADQGTQNYSPVDNEILATPHKEAGTAQYTAPIVEKSDIPYPVGTTFMTVMGLNLANLQIALKDEREAKLCDDHRALEIWSAEIDFLREQKKNIASGM